MNQFSRQRPWFGGAIVALLLVLMLVSPRPVFAGTASYSANGTSFAFTADPGERNIVTVRGAAAAIFVKDDGAPITPGPGCVPSGPREVRCTPAVSQCGLVECYASVDLGDGNDRAIVEDRVLGSTTVRGGGGNDRLEGLRGPLNFDGGAGDDTILGSSGDDYLTGGTGADLLQGRGGIDTTGYDDRTQAVVVTLDNKANDGAAGEHDDVRTENVTGGAGADRLVGNDGTNLLIGGEGADVDQPEENLDNETIAELLVPAIKHAKGRRQVILVTHNPNLAVVCDADQIVHASIDKANGNAITYESGSLENPLMAQRIIDVLEGTKPAFDLRSAKYRLLSLEGLN